MITIADVIIKLKVMPIGPEVDMEELSNKCKTKIESANAEVHKTDIQEVAFGLKAIIFTFIGDEKTINADKIEADINALENVSTTDIIDVRRAFG
ncbi:elongation factor 1-beta [Candidatus Woesearchaeota archaeon]|nr:elongation factor 1-beta [Candidatus Woesearchaeota archaeon]